LVKKESLLIKEIIQGIDMNFSKKINCGIKIASILGVVGVLTGCGTPLPPLPKNLGTLQEPGILKFKKPIVFINYFTQPIYFSQAMQEALKKTLKPYMNNIPILYYGGDEHIQPSYSLTWNNNNSFTLSYTFKMEYYEFANGDTINNERVFLKENFIFITINKDKRRTVTGLRYMPIAVCSQQYHGVTLNGNNYTSNMSSLNQNNPFEYCIQKFTGPENIDKRMSQMTSLITKNLEKNFYQIYNSMDKSKRISFFSDKDGNVTMAQTLLKSPHRRWISPNSPSTYNYSW